MIYQTFISKELRLVKFLIEIWCVSEFVYSNFINLLNLWKAWWIFWNIPLHSFSEELALLTSAAIYNLIWGSFTFLASKVGLPPKIHQKRENLRCQSYSHLELSSTASIWSTSSTRWPFFKFFKIFFPITGPFPGVPSSSLCSLPRRKVGSEELFPDLLISSNIVHLC